MAGHGAEGVPAEGIKSERPLWDKGFGFPRFGTVLQSQQYQSTTTTVVRSTWKEINLLTLIPTVPRQLMWQTHAPAEAPVTSAK